MTSYVNFKYLVEQPLLSKLDPAIMRGCKEIVQDIFANKIVSHNSTSSVRMEDSGIHLRKSIKDSNYIEIEFNVVEEEPAIVENTEQYFKQAWDCQKKLLEFNKKNKVRCYTMFDLHVIIKNKDGSSYEDMIP